MRVQYHEEAFPKNCTCCGRSYNLRQWVGIAYVGLQEHPDPQKSMELRNCSCGSTLAVRLVLNVPTAA